MQALTILHLLAMFVAFAFTAGAGILVSAVANQGEVRTIRTVTRIASPFQMAGGITLLFGAAFGIGTAMMAGIPLTSKWLVAAYILVGLIFAMGFGVHRRWQQQLGAAATASPDDQASPELVALTNDPIARIAGPVTGLFWIAVIAVMVLKPS